MFGLPTLASYAIAALGALGLIFGAYFYVSHLNSTIDKLKGVTIQLQDVNEQFKANEVETERRTTIIREIPNNYIPIYQKQNEEYNNEINSIQDDVSKGIDRPVGPLLNSYFNGLLDDTNTTSNQSEN